MTPRRIVLDANILIRAVLGVKVGSLLATYADAVEFCAPSIAFEDAEANLPSIMAKRGIGAAELALGLDAVRLLVAEVPEVTTQPMRTGGAATDRSPRPRRLADRCHRPCSGVSDLDGRPRLLRGRSRNVDERSRGDLPARRQSVTTRTKSKFPTAPPLVVDAIASTPWIRPCPRAVGGDA